ncbi:hypothetical protein IC744_12645 [Microbacterium hominis]|uniref:hypothetical protein n=1 Tax=Microbacterium TaxID=33882 RepID=UPI00168BB556|nr:MULTISPECIES: hypothetical protein [Microbacterium]QOC27093.1 hypothetical protein IC745_06900 [Microbacterium hominis]QOC28250.1 hypothetical protein IC744_12645 [Microbacterium hominis]QYF96571.1 hypothetical protein KY498_10245 [Microbacterium sp. PAMC21962]
MSTSEGKLRSSFTIMPVWANILSGLILAAGLLAFTFTPQPTWPTIPLVLTVVAITIVTRFASRRSPVTMTRQQRTALMIYASVAAIVTLGAFAVAAIVVRGSANEGWMAWGLALVVFLVVAGTSLVARPRPTSR